MDAEKYEAIKQKVFTAFANVTLEDGTGYWEANAIEDYLLPTSKEYQDEKALDERIDFRKVYEVVEQFESFPQSAHCFMDAKGLHFFLPIILLLADQSTKENVLKYWVENKNTKYLELMNLLSLEQKHCIIACIEHDVDYENSVMFYENFKGNECEKCGQIHHPKNYSNQEAKDIVENGDEYLLLAYLREYFQI